MSVMLSNTRLASIDMKIQYGMSDKMLAQVQLADDEREEIDDLVLSGVSKRTL